MPGIAGIISHRSPEECQQILRAMIESMQYESFYVSGTCFMPEIGVYGGWVAHQGSFAARQSAYGEQQNDVTLLFSGECFLPFLTPDRSASTECQGNSDRDVEQLLCLYNELGDCFVEQMNGLFSGLLIDRKRKRALLFNDRYGIERIYFYEKDGMTFFASEAKALLQVAPELRGFDDEGVAQFLAFGCTLGERTLFRNVRLLPGGSMWTFNSGGEYSRKEQYFQPREWESQPVLTEEAFEIEFMQAFKRILPRYVSSDSSVGISLTGGLDTRMIMACIPSDAIKPACYTFSGLTGEMLDVRLAARVAQACGLDHHTIRIGTDFLSDYGCYVDKTVFITDGCAGALGAHEVYLNAKARALAPIRLTGNFGSEILRSVSTFKPINLSSALFNVDFKKILDSSFTDVSGNKHPVTFTAFQEVPWNLFGTLAAGRSQLTFRTPYLDNEIVELAFRAPVSSRQSPRSALRLVNENNPDLGRIPTDRGLLWGSRGLPHVMRRFFAEATFKLDYLHKEGLPHWLSPLDPLIGSLSRLGLLDLHKFLAYRSWFRRPLVNYINDVLSDIHTQQLPYWNSHFLSSIAVNHASGKKNYIQEIHAVLTLEAIERVLIRGFSEHAD